ncbi:Ff.00g129410.m01.CDS01 [Fusarium sp. VM40]|nr:Ff.00g129410.m01.CDS01 [Fusarium sp. VM40]
MDPFQGLPSLIQTEIFEHLETESSITQLIQASPSMLRHFLAYKKSILQSILNRLLKGDTSGHLLRDALGIIYVSDITTAKAYHHGNLWQTRELPDPIGLADLQTLFRLFSRVIIMIEDYANKATSIYPPRSYLGLPDLILGNEAEFKGQRLGAKTVRFSFLSPTERYRFLRAFLRHELFCRVYHPKYWHFTELDDPEDLWARYGTSESPSLNDLSSVHEYYESVYGALCAHCQDSWLPDIPHQSATRAIEEHVKVNDGGNRVNPTSQDHGLLFPDNMFLDAEEYLEDLNYHCAGKQGDLPFFGLDLLVQLIRFLKRNPDKGKVISKWLDQTPMRSNAPAWLDHLGDTVASDQSYPFPDPTEGHAMKPPPRRNTVYRGSGANQYQQRGYLSRREWRRLRALQQGILEQRAWGFFENTRFYPARQYFPTLNDIYQLDKQQAEMFLAPKLERRRRRSQKWHDYKMGKSLDPPVESDDDECRRVSLKGNLGPSQRFFDSSSGSKLPVIRVSRIP